VRHPVQRRIARFSSLVGLIAALAVGVGSVGLSAIKALRELRATNAEMLDRIPCVGIAETTVENERKSCDIARIQNDSGFDPADYVVTVSQYALVWYREKHPGFWLDAIDPGFVKQFREPRSVVSVTGAKWRLFSKAAGAREIFVGYLEDASWLVEPTPASPKIDHLLRDEASRISQMMGQTGGIEVGRVNSKLDGWAVLDGRNGEVFAWNGDLPGKIVEARRGSVPPLIHREGADVFFASTDSNGQLISVSLSRVVGLRELSGTMSVAGLGVALGVYWFASTRFRRQFILAGRKPAEVGEALRSGEGQTIEFKREWERDGILKAITAFANSNDGTVFVGVSDDRDVRGLTFSDGQNRDQVVTGLQNAIRDRIRPNPVYEIEFLEFKGKVIGRIFVPRGEKPLYSCDGRPYLRKGPQTVVADGDEVARVVLEFA
jgi:Putative DNA-binding domain